MAPASGILFGHHSLLRQHCKVDGREMWREDSQRCRSATFEQEFDSNNVASVITRSCHSSQLLPLITCAQPFTLYTPKLPCATQFKFPTPHLPFAAVKPTYTSLPNMQNCYSIRLKRYGRNTLRPSRRGIRAGAVQPASFLGERDCPPKALETVQTIREAVAHSTIGPYADIASEDTLIINPPWADEPRAMVTQPLVNSCPDVLHQSRRTICHTHTFALGHLACKLRVFWRCM